MGCSAGKYTLCDHDFHLKEVKKGQHWYCDHCKRNTYSSSSRELLSERYRCSQRGCKIDLCRKCLDDFQAQVGETALGRRIVRCAHTLQRNDTQREWYCDGCRKSTYFSGGMKTRWSCQDGCKFDLCQSCYLQREGYPVWTCPSCHETQLLPGQKAKARTCKRCEASAAAKDIPSQQPHSPAPQPASSLDTQPALQSTPQPASTPPVQTEQPESPVDNPSAPKPAPAVSNCPPLPLRPKPVPDLQPLQPLPSGFAKPLESQETFQSDPTPRLPGGISSPKTTQDPPHNTADCADGQTDVAPSASTKSWRRSRKSKKDQSSTDHSDESRSSRGSNARASGSHARASGSHARAGNTAPVAVLAAEAAADDHATARGSVATQLAPVWSKEDMDDNAPIEVTADEAVTSLGFSISKKNPSIINKVEPSSWAGENGIKAGDQIFSANGHQRDEDPTTFVKLLKIRPLTLVLLPKAGLDQLNCASCVSTGFDFAGGEGEAMVASPNEQAGAGSPPGPKKKSSKRSKHEKPRMEDAEPAGQDAGETQTGGDEEGGAEPEAENSKTHLPETPGTIWSGESTPVTEQPQADRLADDNAAAPEPGLLPSE